MLVAMDTWHRWKAATATAYSHSLQLRIAIFQAGYRVDAVSAHVVVCVLGII